MVEQVGILHPGAMGVSVAASARNSGCEVFWLPDGRGPQTQRRAQEHSLVALRSLDELCKTCTIIVSVCPPHAAEALADQVAAHAFEGIYADVNAISPQRAQRIGQRLEARGIAFVDGGIIGPPAWKTGTTWLHLSGRGSQRVADCFSAGPLQAEVIGEEIGRASALKMCYAACTKGTTALLCASLAAADTLGVRENLQRQWSLDGSGMAERVPRQATEVTAKAWRFVGEMEEIAATFTQAGMPGGFHEAAAELYRRLAGFRGLSSTPALAEVLSALQGGAGEDRAG